jgi:chemotaxis protein MotD
MQPALPTASSNIVALPTMAGLLKPLLDTAGFGAQLAKAVSADTPQDKALQTTPSEPKVTQPGQPPAVQPVEELQLPLPTGPLPTLDTPEPQAAKTRAQMQVQTQSPRRAAVMSAKPDATLVVVPDQPVTQTPQPVPMAVAVQTAAVIPQPPEQPQQYAASTQVAAVIPQLPEQPQQRAAPKQDAAATPQPPAQPQQHAAPEQVADIAPAKTPQRTIHLPDAPKTPPAAVTATPSAAPVVHPVVPNPDITGIVSAILPSSTEPAPGTASALPSIPPETAARASPAAQMAPALMALGHAPDGAHRLTVRLDPPELGQVQIRIDRPSDAPARVEITVERSETLTLLLRDQPQLQRALDQAGIPTDGRSVTFHVATPEPVQRSDTATIQASSATFSGMSGDSSQTRQGNPRSRQSTTLNDTIEDEAVLQPIWLRAGLDITA